MANVMPQQVTHTKRSSRRDLFIESMTNFHRKMNHIIVNISVKERTKATFHLYER